MEYPFRSQPQAGRWVGVGMYWHATCAELPTETPLLRGTVEAVSLQPLRGDGGSVGGLITDTTPATARTSGKLPRAKWLSPNSLGGVWKGSFQLTLFD